MEKWLVVGLGNPGLGYRNTRHNIGWKAIDRFAKSLGVRLKKTSCGAKIIRTVALGRQLLLAKPLSFMNLSGKPVKCLISANEIPRENIIVICDDIDLPVGTIRIKKKGGSGGQKGIGSIITEIGTSDFYRIKIGIGRPSDGDVVDYVLKNPTKDDEQILKDMIKKVSDAVATLIESGFETAANTFNTSSKPKNEDTNSD
ncbi:MAG: aminoacyl-tRNA hydrolase [Caldisericia bacterium]